MPRLARVTIPGIPYHVTQRGNRRQPVFFSEDDRHLYLRILLEQSRRYRLTFWAYCLMDNHVHFVAVPEREDSLARAFGEAHRRYTWTVNRRERWTGYLWQGRFASFPLDEAHLFAAMRYVERNPVEAGMVRWAEDYPWSSARAHAHRKDDPLLADNVVVDGVTDWTEFLRHPDEKTKAQIEQHSRTGRPFGRDHFVDKLEQLTGRILKKQSPGRKKK